MWNDAPYIQSFLERCVLMLKISKRTVEALEAQDRDVDHYDEELKGFGVRVRPSGRKTYFVMMRHRCVMRRFTIGTHGAVTAEAARLKAKQIISDLAIDKNPTEVQEAVRNSVTVRSLGERFIEEYVPSHLKPSTQGEYKRCVEIFINPEIGTLKLVSVERADIAKIHHQLRHVPYQANRVLGVLSIMFNLAENWGLRPQFSNPCRGIKKFKEYKRERFLNREELRRLGEALRIEEEFAPSAVACIRLLLLTGCRLGEIQTLKWSYLDLDTCLAFLPDSKTGRKTLYLGSVAVKLLQSIPRRKNNLYVITGDVEGQHLTDMQKPWRRIRKLAELPDVRIHDLRHTFASSGVALGQGLPIIGKLLGHSQPQTTARYAHLAASPALEVADKISENLAELIEWKEAS
jgi:integrase